MSEIEFSKAYTSAVLALLLPPDVAQQVALDPDLCGGTYNGDGIGAIPLGDLHLTLCYLGDAEELRSQSGFLRQMVENLAKNAKPLTGRLSGRVVFDVSGGRKAHCAHFDSPDLPAWRQELVEMMGALGYRGDADHGFTPHVTLCYAEDGTAAPEPQLPQGDVTLDRLALLWGGKSYAYPMGEAEQMALYVPFEKGLDNVLIFPFGRYKRGGIWRNFTREMGEKMVKNFKENVLERIVPVNREHERWKGMVGNIKRVWLSDDGVRGELAPREGDEEDVGRFLYFSPEVIWNWTHPRTGEDHECVLAGGGLTNYPFHLGRMSLWSDGEWVEFVKGESYVGVPRPTQAESYAEIFNKLSDGDLLALWEHFGGESCHTR